MSAGTGWRQLTDDVALISFPWRTLGIDFRRNVTLLRLADGRVVIHSTAPFTEQDIAAIRRFGEPSWLVEATLMHDTFAKEGRAALPHILYLAPVGFARPAGFWSTGLGRLAHTTHAEVQLSSPRLPILAPAMTLWIDALS